MKQLIAYMELLNAKTRKRELDKFRTAAARYNEIESYLRWNPPKKRKPRERRTPALRVRASSP